MAEKITWALNVQVTGGPKVAASNSMEVNAYDKVETVVPANDSATVDVQPGDGAKFLLVAAGAYENLTYVVDGGDPITLDGPHVLIGSGAVSLLGDTQNQFVFTNSGGEDLSVSILVGRNATP